MARKSANKNLNVGLRLQTSEFKKGVNDAVSAAKNVQKEIAGIGNVAKIAGAAVATSQIVGFAKDALDSVDKLAKTSKRLGLTIEEYQGLQFAARQTGVSIADLDSSIEKLNKSVGDAKSGNKVALKSFDRLGLSIEDVINAKGADRFRLVAEAIKNVDEVSDQASISNAIFGKSVQKVVTLLNQGSDGIGAYIDRAKELGVITTDEAKIFEDFNDATDELKTSMLVAAAKGIGPFVDLAKDGVKVFTEGFVPILKETARIIQENKTFFKTSAISVAGLTAALVIGATTMKAYSVGAGLVTAAQTKMAASATAAATANTAANTTLSASLAKTIPLLAKAGAVGIAAFAGWGIGRTISELTSLDEKLNLVFTTFEERQDIIKINEETTKGISDIERAELLRQKRAKEGIELTKEQAQEELRFNEFQNKLRAAKEEAEKRTVANAKIAADDAKKAIEEQIKALENSKELKEEIAKEKFTEDANQVNRTGTEEQKNELEGLIERRNELDQRQKEAAETAKKETEEAKRLKSVEEERLKSLKTAQELLKSKKETAETEEAGQLFALKEGIDKDLVSQSSELAALFKARIDLEKSHAKELKDANSEASQALKAINTAIGEEAENIKNQPAKDATDSTSETVDSILRERKKAEELEKESAKLAKKGLGISKKEIQSDSELQNLISARAEFQKANAKELEKGDKESVERLTNLNSAIEERVKEIAEEKKQDVSDLQIGGELVEVGSFQERQDRLRTVEQDINSNGLNPTEQANTVINGADGALNEVDRKAKEDSSKLQEILQMLTSIYEGGKPNQTLEDIRNILASDR